MSVDEMFFFDEKPMTLPLYKTFLMTITFGLSYRKESARINVSTEPYPNRWTHHVMIGTKEEIDDELLSWIIEAAEFAERK